jgi:hypothetical protein
MGGPVWTTLWEEKSYPYQDPNSDPSANQPVASRYTDCTIPAQSVKRAQRGEMYDLPHAANFSKDLNLLPELCVYTCISETIDHIKLHTQKLEQTNAIT